MKNLTNILNVFLIIAVGILFYLYFSIRPTRQSESEDFSKTTKNEVIGQLDLKKMSNSKIVFINVDSITLGYDYIKDETKTLSAKQQLLENQYQSMTTSFQKEYQLLQESAQAGIAPRSELEKKQNELQLKQQEIIQKENQMKALELEVAKKQEEMMGTVNEFIIRFNKVYNYDFILSKSSMINSIAFANEKLEITNAVLKGLNDEYNAKKVANKKK